MLYIVFSHGFKYLYSEDLPNLYLQQRDLGLLQQSLEPSYGSLLLLRATVSRPTSLSCLQVCTHLYLINAVLSLTHLRKTHPDKQLKQLPFFPFTTILAHFFFSSQSHNFLLQAVSLLCIYFLIHCLFAVVDISCIRAGTKCVFIHRCIPGALFSAWLKVLLENYLIYE